MRRIEDRLAKLEARNDRRPPRIDPEIERFFESLPDEELDRLEEIYRRLAEEEPPPEPTVVRRGANRWLTNVIGD
jgi:hypothetical protein